MEPLAKIAIDERFIKFFIFSMLVLIRTIKGDTFKIPVELDTTVRQMKDLISEAASLSSSDMKIVHKAVVL